MKGLPDFFFSLFLAPLLFLCFLYGSAGMLYVRTIPQGDCVSKKKGKMGEEQVYFLKKKKIYIYILLYIYNNKELHIEDGYSTYIYTMCVLVIFPGQEAPVFCL